MRFHDIARRGIDNIYSKDLESQEKFLTTVCRTVRKMDSINSLLKAEAFFVPNQDYMKVYFGVEALDTEYDMYSWDGVCLWDNYIVFPIKNIVGTIVGFAGFDPINKAKVQSGMDVDHPSYYRYSNSSVFNRGKYIYSLHGVYERAVKDGYIVLVDGIFDMLSLSDEGFNVGSLLGSQITDEVLFQLRFIDCLFVAEDNDTAGRQLYTELKRRHPNVKYIRQNSHKDVDDILKSEYKEEYINSLRNSITLKQDLALRLKPLKL